MSPSDRLDVTVTLSKPAHRALAHAGIVTFADLAGWTQCDIAELHGVGPKALPELIAGLASRGLAFRNGQ